MVKHRLLRTATVITAASVFLALPSSCVNEEYDITKIDTTVSVGGDALVFPLGSTEQLKLKTLLSEDDFQYITSLEGGVYGFKMSDSMDLSDDIPDLTSELKIDPVTINESFDENLGDIDLSDLTIDAQSIENNITFDGVDVPDIVIPSERFEESVATGIWEYTPSSDQMDMTEGFGTNDIAFDELLDPAYEFSDLLAGLPGDQAIQIPDAMIPGITLPGQSTRLTVNIELPDGISNVRDIELSPNASMVISMSLQNSFLSSGTVTPAITLDHTGLMTLEGVSGALDLSDDFILSADNSYSVTHEYRVASLAIESDDWNGNILNKTANITAAGGITLSGISSTPDMIRASSNDGGLGVLVSISFRDIVIEDMTMDVETIEDNIQPEPFVIAIDPVELPEQVSGVSEVRLSQNSGIDIEIKPTNFSGLGQDFNTSVTDLVIQFPSEIVAEGLDEQNRYVIDNVDLTQPTTQHIAVTAFRPDPAVDGVITMDGNITVSASMTAGGTVSMSGLPATEADDPAIDIVVGTTFEVEDFALTLNTVSHEISEEENFPIEMPDGVGEIGTLEITPDGTPVLTVNVSIPEMQDIEVRADNLKISFPEMLVFKNVPTEYNWQESDNSINFDNEEIPENIELEIEKIVVTPVLDNTPGSETEGKYVANGKLVFSGAASVETVSSDGTVSSVDIESLVEHGISITGTIPQITASEVSFERFSRTVSNSQEITLLDPSNLPAELQSLTVEEVVLTGTELTMSLQTENVPDMGTDLYLDLQVALPSEIITDDDRVDENNVLHVSGNIVDDSFEMEPVAITGLDLKDVDFSSDEPIVRNISIEGTISAENPAINTDDLRDRVITINVTGGIPEVNIEKITGYVDYDLGADGDLSQSISLADLPDFMKGEDFTLDFENPYIEMTVTSNVGIPVEGEIEIVPVFGDVPDEEAAQTISISIPAAESAGMTKTYWIAATQDGMPSGYEFLEANIASLLKRIPDSISLNINAHTDAEQLSTIETSAEYELTLGYDVVVPFVFGEDLDISMDYTIPGESDNTGETTGSDNELPPILGELLNMNSLSLGGYVESSLPLRLELSIDLLDSNGEVIPTEPSVMTIGEGSTDNPVQSPIDLTLKLAEGADGTDLTRLRMNFKVTSGNMSGEPVTEDSYIQAVLKVKVPGGITIDLSSLGTPENTDDNTGNSEN